MLNPIFRKKVQGQKHPGRWGIVEHQIPSIKVLFKINAKSHKHPGIKLLPSESSTQLVNQRKQKVSGHSQLLCWKHSVSGQPVSGLLFCKTSLYFLYYGSIGNVKGHIITRQWLTKSQEIKLDVDGTPTSEVTLLTPRTSTHHTMVTQRLLRSLS